MGLWLYKRDCRGLSSPFLPCEEDTVNKMIVCGPGKLPFPDTESAAGTLILGFANSQTVRNGFGWFMRQLLYCPIPLLTPHLEKKKLNVARNKGGLRSSRGHGGCRGLNSSSAAGPLHFQPGRITEAVCKSWPMQSVTYLSVFAYWVFKFPPKSPNLCLTSYLSRSLL